MRTPVLLRSDRGEISNPAFLEIPVRGPGLANCLVVITGLATSGTPDGAGLDVNSEDAAFGEVLITTNYFLDKADKWLGIINNNTELRHATYVTLTAIAADDDDDTAGFTLAVNEVETTVDENDGNRVRIRVAVALQGDSTISKIGYQANILIRKIAGPQ